MLGYSKGNRGNDEHRGDVVHHAGNQPCKEADSQHGQVRTAEPRNQPVRHERRHAGLNEHVGDQHGAGQNPDYVPVDRPDKKLLHGEKALGILAPEELAAQEHQAHGDPDGFGAVVLAK